MHDATDDAGPDHFETPPGTAAVVWLDGALVDASTASLHWSDHGITVGDGVFETIKLVGDAPFALTEHLERLARSAAGLHLAIPDRGLIQQAVERVARRWAERNGPDRVARLRLTVTAGPGPAGSERGTSGPTLMVSATPMVLTREPTDVVVVPWTRNERGALVGLKTISYAENVVALAHARQRGATEAIFANTRGELCEGTGTNVFLEHRGVLATPPLSSGCLDGITRSLLMGALSGTGSEVIERPLPMDALHEASEAFLVSTGREVQPIARVDSTALGAAPGPLTLAAMDAWDGCFG